MNITKTIYMATDHAGYELKEYIKSFLKENYPDIYIIDFGANTYEPADDYDDYVHKAGGALAHDINQNILDSKSIVFGGSGQGEGMIMNRYKGVRCTVYYGGELSIISLGREHNDANALSLGARFINQKEIKQIINLFLNTDFEAGRHVNRVIKIDNLL